MNYPKFHWPLKTTRLSIAPPSFFKLNGHHYLEDLHAIYSDTAVQKFLGQEGVATDRGTVAEIINEENEYWQNPQWGQRFYLTLDSLDDRAVGIVRIQPSPMPAPRDTEIIFAIHPEFRGKQYATESVREVLNHEFRQGLPRIVARIETSNTGSVRVVQSLGFIRGEDRIENFYAPPHIEHVYELEKLMLT